MAKKQKKEAKLKQEAQKFLAKVPEENVFWCHDGRILRDMRDLGEALAGMSEETFTYHANTDKRDFSNWVRDVIGDTVLAKELENMMDRNQATSIVTERIAILTKS